MSANDGIGACFHGGAFFEAIGERFEDIGRHRAIVNADVLDAWFPPAPGVIAALEAELEWLARTSPPVGGAGLQDVIAGVRGVPAACVLPGAGSSDLIFLAMREWLTAESRVLLLDPCYGEYAHVFERVIGCRVDRFHLHREEAWAPDLDALASVIARGSYDLVVIVNPNNPTGHYIERVGLDRLIDAIPRSTRVWIDEAYLEYVEGAESLETVAAARANVFVCKSMSKVYALSGMRVAYLCGARDSLAHLRRITPPWAVSLPAQVAAVRALENPEYYASRYRETARLRRELDAALRAIPSIVDTSGAANFILCHLDPRGPAAATVIERSRRAGIYLRDVASMGSAMGTHVLRTAVKDAAANATIVTAIAEACAGEVDANFSVAAGSHRSGRPGRKSFAASFPIPHRR